MSKIFFANRTKLFKIGITITVVFSAITGFLNIGVLFLFGVPILGLIFGLILIWFSKEILLDKIIATTLPVPVILFTFLVFLFCLPIKEPEVFLIPKNFRGKIAIYYNQNCGQNLPHQNEKKIYDVSKTSIFITSENQTFGLINRKFYFVDENGKKFKIPEFHWTKFEEERNDWHWLFSDFEITPDLVGYFTQRGTLYYQSYVISDYQSLATETKENCESKEKSFTILSDSVLNECKRKK